MTDRKQKLVSWGLPLVESLLFMCAAGAAAAVAAIGLWLWK
jgi:hypothetical protein